MKLVKIAIAQSSCGHNIEENMKKSALQVEELASKGAQIICLQEMYRSRYFCVTEDYKQFELAETIPGPSTELFSVIAKKYQSVIIIPIFEKRTAGIYHNSIVVIDADGSIAGVYRKMHIPDDPAFYEKFYFTPGDLGFKAIQTKYAKIGTLICWDQWYPEAARLTAMMGAEIIFYPTAIGWDATEPQEWGKPQLEAWLTMQKSHAIANGVFVCAANRIGQEEDLTFWGNSFISNPLGEIISQTTHEKETTFCIEIDLDQIEYYRQRWPFFRDRRIDSYSEITKRYID